MLSNEEYWQQRAEQNALKLFTYSKGKADLITRWFNRTSKEMQEKIDTFYKAYATQEGLNLDEAKTALNDKRAYQITIQEFMRIAQNNPQDPVLQAILKKSYFNRAISREEFLLLQLNLLESELYQSYAEETEKSLTQVFEEGYYKTLFDTQQFVGFGGSFNRISTHQIQSAVETAWHGKNYSQRIWGDQRTSLARYLNRIITNGMIQGTSNGQMRAELQKVMNTSAYNARRLIRTECSQVCAQAELAAYRENGTKKFRFLATLDYKTSKICQDMDNKVFLVSEAEIGVNTEPLHPH